MKFFSESINWLSVKAEEKKLRLELVRSEDVHLDFYFAVNKLLTDKTQNMFYLIARQAGFMKYTLNYLYQWYNFSSWGEENITE